MTTDRAGPEGPIGIAVDQGREGGDHSAACLYWLGPDGLYVLNAFDGITVLWSDNGDVTSWEPGETGSFVAAVVNSAGPWELTHDNGLIPEAPAKPAGDPNG